MKADCASQGDGLELSPEAGRAEEVGGVDVGAGGVVGGGGWVGHAWLAVASVVSLTLRPSRHRCQH